VIARLKAPHDGYFVVCDAIADDLVLLGIDRNQVFDVKNAVDTERFHPERVSVELDEAYQRKFDTLGDEIRLGFVGGLQSYKGLDDLASALDEVETACQIVVAGDGPERKRLERRFGEQAVFLGAVPYEQVPAIYHRIDVLVLPSHTEGLPRVVLEAQAHSDSRNCDTSRRPPRSRRRRKTGLLVDPRAPNRLATAIDKLGNDATYRAQLGRDGRRAVVESYSWQTMYERYERFLEKVVNS